MFLDWQRAGQLFFTMVYVDIPTFVSFQVDEREVASSKKVLSSPANDFP